ncbi:MAG: TolC family protein, partial [Candidatus Binatia bacterium]
MPIAEGPGRLRPQRMETPATRPFRSPPRGEGARRTASLAALALGFGGCAVGPSYRPPVPAVPSAWIDAPASAAELTAWWGVFDDRVLRSLVERAVAANLDLRAAEARVREARALRRVVAADFWPGADAAASYTHTTRGESAEDSPDDVAEAGAIRTVRAGDLFRASLDALWEIDLFGGVARSIEAAEADVDVAVEERRATLVRLLGDVVATYVEARALQRELATTRKNLVAQEDTLALTEARGRAGLASDLDVDRARA